MVRQPTNIPGSLPKLVGQFVAEVDDRGRVRIPAAAVQAVEWLNQKSGPDDALAVLDKPGRINLLSWTKESPKILAHIDELTASAEHDEEALEMLAILEDRYKKLRVSKEMRPTMPPEVLMHLGIFDVLPIHIYVERHLNSINLITYAYRNIRLRDSAKNLNDDLP